MATQAQGTSVSANYLSPVRRIRAVVADDSPDMQRVIAWILERDGLVDVVGTADTGSMAIALTEAMAPDLVVLDVNMPVMNGFEAALLIKKSSPETKILIVSSDDNPDLGLCAIDCGADGFLWKSNLLRECKSRIERIFE